MTRRTLLFGFGFLALAAGGAVVLAQSEEEVALAPSDFPVDIVAGAELYGRHCQTNLTGKRLILNSG